MKGVVLAGGLGSRLNPLTKVTNKHLLPIYDKPMIYYPIQTLVNAGIRDILVVTGGKNAGEFLRLLGNGKEFGLKHVNYTYQEGEGGIAQALGLAEFFAEGEPICVILGDNIIETNVCRAADEFRKAGKGAKIILKQVTDADRFGVAEIKGDRIVGIITTGKAKTVANAPAGETASNGTMFCANCFSIPAGTGWNYGNTAAHTNPTTPGSAPTVSWATLLANPGVKNEVDPWWYADARPQLQTSAATGAIHGLRPREVPSISTAGEAKIATLRNVRPQSPIREAVCASASGSVRA